MAIIIGFLMRQGAGAPGGAYDYLVKGKMGRVASRSSPFQRSTEIPAS